MSNAEKTTGQKILELRRLKKLTGHALAREAGIAHERLNMIETDMIKNPSKEHLLRIAEALEVAVDDLV